MLSAVCLTKCPYSLPKRVLNTVQFSAPSLNFQYNHASLRSFNSCLLHLPRRSVTSIISSIFPLMLCFKRQILCKMWPKQLAFLFLLYTGYSSRPWLKVTLLHFSHDLSNWSPSFSSTTYQNFTGISGLLAEVLKSQHHKNLYSKRRTSLVYSLKLSPIRWWKEVSSCWVLLLPWQSWT